MSHVIPIEKIDQFLPREKLGLNTQVNPETGLPEDHDKVADLEETARDNVFAALNVVYDTSEWIDEGGKVQSPSLVVNALGLLVAGWLYDRQFSEESTSAGGYGQRRVREAWAIINGIIEGTLALDGVDRLDEGMDEPSVLETEPVFVMGEQF